MKRCGLCNRPIKKPKKKFCCNKHKDRYHNERRSLLGSASAFQNHFAGDIENDFNPGDPYALGQE